MRSIERTTAKVPTLFSEKGSGWKKAKANREKYQRGQFHVDQEGRNNLSFRDHWNKPDVRGALNAQQGKVCAYCGCKLTRSDRGDVEHFRPKKQVEEDKSHGGYWWLAYDFDNYVLSCRKCNGRSRKGSKFPLRVRARRRVTFANRHDLSREARSFLDPTIDPIENLIRVEWRDGSCDIFPVDGITRTKRTQVEAMIEYFRFNLDPKLIRERTKKADKVTKLIEEGKLDEAGKLAIRYRPHSLVARQILLDTYGADYLPTPSAEFQFLLDDLFEDLREVLRLLGRRPYDRELLDDADELLWTLAIWVAAPPDGAPVDLAGLLEQHGLTEEIDKRIRFSFEDELSLEPGSRISWPSFNCAQLVNRPLIHYRTLFRQRRFYHEWHKSTNSTNALFSFPRYRHPSPEPSSHLLWVRFLTNSYHSPIRVIRDKKCPVVKSSILVRFAARRNRELP